MHIKRFMFNVLCPDLKACQEFYTTLFDFEAAFESDWFIQLVSTEQGIELGLIQQEHAIVPAGVSVSAGGGYLTFVLEEVESIYQVALEADYTITSPPHDTFYGQRRLLIIDPAGTMLDLSAPTAPPPQS